MRVSIFLGVLLASSVMAQGGFRPFRVTVDEDGLYAITFSDVATHIDPRRIPTDRLALVRNGLEVPIEVQGGRDGRMDPGDAIIFFGRKGKGPHTHDGVYILRLARNPRRIGRLPAVDPGREVVDDGRRHIILEEDRTFVAHATVRQKVIRGGKNRSNWYWREMLAPTGAARASQERGTSATVVAAIHPEPRRSVSAELVLDLVGPPVPGIKQRVIVNVNGRDLAPIEWDTPLEKQLRVRVPAGILERKNSIQVRNLSPVPIYDEPENEIGRSRNRIWLDRITISVPSLLMGPANDTEQVLYRLERSRLNPSRPLSFTRLRSDGLMVYDVSSHAWARAGKFEPRPGRGPIEVVCAGLGEFKDPKSVSPLRATDVHRSGQGGDWVVVTTSRLRPLLRPLVEHRRAQGFHPVVVEAQELYDTFSHGRFDPAAIATFIRKAHRNWKTKPRYVLLVGDADRAADWVSTRETLPTMMVMTDYNGATATDALFGDLNGDGLPDISVGRLPVRTPDELLRMVSRTIDLETKPPSGTWRRRLRFVAGEARFSPIIDSLLERTFRRVVGREIPAAFRLSMTWSNPRSPFFWPAGRFSERVVSEFNAGSLVFTYVGHGSAQAFDSITDASGLRHPILDVTAAADIDAGGRNPVLAIIACWTGEFDRPERDCISELLLRKKGGPAAVIASSRISHPYPDALIGLGLARAFFKGRRPLGDVLQEARKTMLAEADGAIAKMARPFLSKALDPALLVKDHLYLYNLLGDPATVVPFPERDLVVATPNPPRVGEPMEVHVACGQGGGKLLITLDRPLSRSAPGLEPSDPDASDADARAVRNHRRANDPTVAKTELVVQGGSVKAIVEIPNDVSPGKYHVTAYLVGADGAGDGIGSTTVTVGPKGEPR